jgi:prepilin-type processing-associated H-X9-DG protein
MNGDRQDLDANDADRRWTQAAADLRAIREAQRARWGDVDEAVVSRFIVGAATADEQERVLRAMLQYPALRECIETVRDVLDAGRSLEGLSDSRASQPEPAVAAVPFPPERMRWLWKPFRIPARRLLLPNLTPLPKQQPPRPPVLTEPYAPVEPGGLRIIDLLAIAGVVTVAVSLLIPAIQASREAARRGTCQNNIKQLTQGIILFNTNVGMYPKAGTFLEYPVVNPNDARTSIIWQVLNAPTTPLTDTDAQRCLSNWVVDILPNIDKQQDSSKWNVDQPYFSNASPDPAGIQPSNFKISSSAISILNCPSDPNPQPEGGLSYVANGGFSRWHAIPQSWTTPKDDNDNTAGPGDLRGTGKGDVLQWVKPPLTADDNARAAKGLGVMFLGTKTGNNKWDYQTRDANFVDGTSYTMLITENILAGASSGNIYSGQLPTNWACPLPNFCMFFGPDAVCDGPDSCRGGQLQAKPGGTDGPGWAFANSLSKYTSINYAYTKGLIAKGSFIYANSAHPGGINVGFCDGSVRFIKNTIDGAAYSKLLTPAGSKLPFYDQQLPVSESALN